MGRRIHSLVLAILTMALLLSCRLAPPVKRKEATPTPIVLVATPTPLPPGMVAVSDAEERAVINVYQRVSPAVVHITSKIMRYSFFYGLIPEEGMGSGFVYDKEGHIVTNNHVVEGAEEVQVTLAEGTMVPAEVIGTDPYNDLAVLKADVPLEKLHPVELGSSSNLQVGQRAIAIGNPFGLDRTLTVGVISALERIMGREEERPLGEMIQTDAAINPGNSGGPLLDSQGQVIGVNTAIRGGAENIGFAIPVDTVKRVVPQLIEKGYYEHPWLGFQAYSITPSLAKGLDLPVEKGLLVARIYRDSPADRAGLRGAQREVQVGNYIILAGGDIITAINGTELGSMEELIVYLETKTEVGDVVELTVIRDSQRMTIEAELGARPE